MALGLANLESSIALFELMRDRAQPAEWNRCCAAASLAEHGVELFLKGAIWHGENSPGGTHDLTQLFRCFVRLYPGNNFAFQARIASLVSARPEQPFSEFFRYPITKKRELLHRGVHFDPAIWAKELRLIADELSSKQQAILDRYPYVTVDAKWVRREKGVWVFECQGKEFGIPAVEVVPEPRTNILRIGERGKLTITTWRAREHGMVP